MTVYETGPEKFWTAPEAGLTLAPVWEMTGARLETFVPYGSSTAIVPLASLMDPDVPASVNEVMDFAVFGATATVTVYVFVLLSAAVTVYVTGLEKFWAPVGLISEPVWEIDGVWLVRSVPYGTVRVIVPAASSMLPVTPASVNIVIAFEES